MKLNFLQVKIKQENKNVPMVLCLSIKKITDFHFKNKTLHFCVINRTLSLKILFYIPINT